MAQSLREPTYCTPEDVAETLDLPDPINPNEIFQFTDESHPSYSRVQKLILSAEDEIDQRTRRTWRENRVVNQILDIPTYQWDDNGWRSMYRMSGGYTIQLRKNMLEWDPEKGDRLELRTISSTWKDISDSYRGDGGAVIGAYNAFWFDYEAGRLFLRTRALQPKYNSIRITYRYGCGRDFEGERCVPAAISRATTLIAAKSVLVSDFHSIKVGMGGDVSGLRENAMGRWDEEIGRILSSYQRAGKVHSLLR